MTTTHSLSVYDRLRPHLVAEDVLMRLGINIVRQVGSEAYCDPLCHQSTSHESLQINLHTGRWNCKACQHAGMSGDLIQLVEYVQTHGQAPSRQGEQRTSQSHRDAIRWLCEQYAIPYDEFSRAPGDAALEVVHVFAMAAHEHLMRAPEVLEWIQEKWGFDLATVRDYGIGFMPSPILPSIAVEANSGNSLAAFRASGLGFYPPGSNFTTRFEGRVLFPYLDGAGRAVYLIGRATPWTPRPVDGGHTPKYHKLTVHSEQRPHISARITNDHLYNEPVMEKASVVVVAEGVADAVALSMIGVPVVSPVTISFNETDLERFVRKCRERGIRRVEILFDNELSGSGNYGALRVGRKLVERGIVATVLTLPLGAKQAAARDEVLSKLGPDAFAELERADPRRRKEIVAERVQDDAGRAWIVSQIEASKIDAAEWVALEGPGAAEKFAAIREAGVDVVAHEIARIGATINPAAAAQDRLSAFGSTEGMARGEKSPIQLAALIDDRITRGEYAGLIAKAAGKGITKVDVGQRISEIRKIEVARRRQEEDRAEAESKPAIPPTIVLLPPDQLHAKPAAPKPPQDPNRPPAPPPPGPAILSEHDRYEPVRTSVATSIDKKVPEDIVGRRVAQTITYSMGFTVFRTPEELVLVRGNERVDVGVVRSTPEFNRLLYLASSLTHSKSSHRSYIAAVIYFLELEATKASDVSWSHYDPHSGSIFFPTGDPAGSIFRITPGSVYHTRMSEARVPAVAGQAFRPILYAEDCGGGIDDVLELTRWVSLSPGDRLLLVYWIACLPLLRFAGEIPIVRVEGGSSSGKSRTVDAIAHLVNGSKTSAVPTAAAMTSKLAREMLTIDDNREMRDMTESLRSTLLQATGQGAREKRRGNSDTQVITERVCGALLMNGIEPIHDGRSEFASRFLILRADRRWRASDSPQQNGVLFSALLSIRNRFWSEAVFRCSQALELDQRWGEPIGLEIEEIFGETRIGRLSIYLRLMYFAWVASQPLADQRGHLEKIADVWTEAFRDVGAYVLQSLMHEELAVSAMRYAFAYAGSLAKQATPLDDQKVALEGRYQESVRMGDAYLGPLSSSQLARIVRAAGKELNAPRSIAIDLTAGQLLARIQDGMGFLRDAGFQVEFQPTARGKVRMSVYREARPVSPTPPAGEAAPGIFPTPPGIFPTQG